MSRSLCQGHYVKATMSRSLCQGYYVKVTMSRLLCHGHYVNVTMSRSPCQGHYVKVRRRPIRPMVTGFPRPISQAEIRGGVGGGWGVRPDNRLDTEPYTELTLLTEHYKQVTMVGPCRPAQLTLQSVRPSGLVGATS